MTKYDLWVGCSPGAIDFYNADDGYFHEATVTNLPLDGGPVFAWLTSSNGTDGFTEKYRFTSRSGGSGFAVYLPGNLGWLDTGIDIEAGSSVQIQACGRVVVNSAGYPAFHPAGDADCPGVWRFSFPAPAEACWSLLARVGDSDPFYVGESYRSESGALQGRLFVAINDDNPLDNSGGYRLNVDVRPPELGG